MPPESMFHESRPGVGRVPQPTRVIGRTASPTSADPRQQLFLRMQASAGNRAVAQLFESILCRGKQTQVASVQRQDEPVADVGDELDPEEARGTPEAGPGPEAEAASGGDTESLEGQAAAEGQAGAGGAAEGQQDPGATGSEAPTVGGGEPAAELEAPDAIEADADTMTPEAVFDDPVVTGEGAAALGADSDSVQAWVGRVVVARDPAPGSPPLKASEVTLEFIPDDSEETKTRPDSTTYQLPIGTIVIRVNKKEAGRVAARGGYWFSCKQKDAPGHTYDPTQPGPWTLGKGRSFTTGRWQFSQLAWGTPMRDTGTDVEYEARAANGKKPAVYKKTSKLATPISRDDILAQEKEYGRAEAVPAKWDLNDFGKTAFEVQGTQDFIHTTPETEDQALKGIPEQLDFSHGCIHVKPSDREDMVAKGYLQGGVKITVRKYRKEKVVNYPTASDPEFLGICAK